MSQPDLIEAPGSPRRKAGWPTPAALRTRLRRGGILLPFVMLFIVLAVASPPFFSTVNLLDILDQQAATLIIAAAGTLVLVAGGIDLSVGATYALAGVVAAHLALTVAPALAIGAGIAVGLAVGAVNGVIATYFRINSLIATLAMSFVVSGLASLATGGNLIIDYSRPGFGDLARSVFVSVNTSTWTMVAVVVALAIALSRTTAGRYMFAAGSNAEAGRYIQRPDNAHLHGPGRDRRRRHEHSRRRGGDLADRGGRLVHRPGRQRFGPARPQSAL
jgi:ribose transport system permease protein